jgi:cytochrome P450
MTTDESTTVPVLPFRHDTDPDIVREPFSGWSNIAAQHRVVGSDQGEAPVWIAMRYPDVTAIMRDTQTFSRRYTDAYSTPVGSPLVPIHLDPPEHTKYRRLLTPLLAPQMVNELEDVIRQRAIELVDDAISKGRVEYMKDFGFRFAPVIFFGLMGLPLDRADEVTIMVDDALHLTDVTDPGGVRRRQAYGEMQEMLVDLIRERRANPQDDYISTLVTAQIDGAPIGEDELRQMCLLLLLAGLDTVAATLGYAMLHFARNEADRRAIIDDPSLIPSAVEEILRFYPIDASIRYVTKENDAMGCPMHAGDRVVLSLVAANRDEHEFEHADTFDLHRAPNRHIGFGVGPHRCAGSNLARIELAIALEEWHRRIPDYRVADGAELSNLVSTTVFRLESLPLEW